MIPHPVSAYEMRHGKDKAGAACAPIEQGHVQGSRCARETRLRHPWEAVRADQPGAPLGSSAEAKIQSDGRAGNHLQLASARRPDNHIRSADRTIGNDGITLGREAPATVNEGEIAVASAKRQS